jgi:hypothetical protein
MERLTERDREREGAGKRWRVAVTCREPGGVMRQSERRRNEESGGGLGKDPQNERRHIKREKESEKELGTQSET